MTGQGQQHSDLVEIARRNGDFRRNYGTLIGAFLYLRSLNAARGRPQACQGHGDHGPDCAARSHRRGDRWMSVLGSKADLVRSSAGVAFLTRSGHWDGPNSMAQPC